MSIVGKNIKRFREDKHITQEELAEHLNVSRQAVSNWECGKTEPDIETLHKIATFLDISVEELIYGEKKQYNIINQIASSDKKTTGIGLNILGFGSCLSMIISYTAWKSIGWAILHGILGWIYVIYYIIKY
jgi:Predicted transcriptional regulators